MRKGTPLASRVAQGVSGPASSCVWNPRVFADDARGRPCGALGGGEAGGPGQGAGQLEPVHLAVAREALRVAEDLAAEFALIGPLAGVHHVVLAQVEGLTEALPAHRALVWLLARVDPLVPLQGLAAPEATPANATAELKYFLVNVSTHRRFPRPKSLESQCLAQSKHSRRQHCL